jgi:hypothetical protein
METEAIVNISKKGGAAKPVEFSSTATSPSTLTSRPKSPPLPFDPTDESHKLPHTISVIITAIINKMRQKASIS